ncbi:hypothetical protein [Clostridium novyi]|uniref:Uncharacterized protein n=3 Tax=Clostridium novyi TaxID=1542 RepID=A0Q0G9_CLONN|nr:hypothetical protein [Clostridium novyi]ABK62087.1 conserved hypothetical protein [Clostridium novyi NT]KEH85077.1 hypothetical protein Z966_08875 [Clostridium novyi A str. NCTC 538]
MKSNKKVFGIIAVILIVICFFSIKPIKHYVIRKDNFNWLAYGIKQQYEAKQLNLQEEIKFSVKGISANNEQEKVFNDMFNNTTLRLDMNYDYDNFRNLTKVKLKNKNEDFGNLELFSNKEGVILKCSDIFNGNLYLDYKDICKFFNTSNDSNSINIENYLPLFDVSKDSYIKNINKDLLSTLKNSLNHKFQNNENVLIKLKFEESEKLVKCNELKISLNSEDIKNILKELNKFAKDNPNIKLFLKSKINQFLDIAVKNNDLDKFGLTNKDVKEFKEDKNFDKYFHKEWEEAFTQIINEIDKTQTNDDFKIDMSFRFDNDDKIRNVLCIYTFRQLGNIVFNVEQNVNINYSIDKQVFDSSKYTKDIKITELTPNNLNSNMDKYLKDMEKKLTNLYPELNNNYNNSGYSNFNNSVNNNYNNSNLNTDYYTNNYEYGIN